MNILIIGAGGREHALAWKFSQQTNVDTIFIAPGNDGIALNKKCQTINIKEISKLVEFAKENNIDLTVVGSEELLAKGIVDRFKAADLAIWGPHQQAAQLESSKGFAKDFMIKHGIKTAKYQRFTDPSSAIAYLHTQSFPLVIKADGLAAGKGVVIAENLADASQAISEIMIDRCFAEAGDSVVIEEFLTGIEASILSFCDGNTIVPMLSAKDHKKIGENETGLNTGGMGVVSPNPSVTDAVYQAFIDDILTPTLTGLQADGLVFSGVIFFGLMINDSGVYLLEYNMRLGDPETQTVLPLLENDLSELIFASINNQLDSAKLQWSPQTACCVVAASKGYPENYDKGFAITGYDTLENSLCFFAGVAEETGQLVTSGGRVLSVVALSDDLTSAREKAYRDLDKVVFSGKTIRTDIGK